MHRLRQSFDDDAATFDDLHVHVVTIQQSDTNKRVGVSSFDQNVPRPAVPHYEGP